MPVRLYVTELFKTNTYKSFEFSGQHMIKINDFKINPYLGKNNEKSLSIFALNGFNDFFIRANNKHVLESTTIWYATRSSEMGPSHCLNTVLFANFNCSVQTNGHIVTEIAQKCVF